MKKTFVTLIVLLVAFAIVMPAAASGNGPGAGDTGTGTGTGQPGSCLCGNSAFTGNSYGPGEPGTCMCGDPTGTGNSYGPGQPGTSGNGEPARNGNGYSYGPGLPGAANGVRVTVRAAALTSTTLTAAESAGLLFMYEEENLARDVYTAMYTRWNQPVFKNIAASEQTHMNAIRTLLVRYGLPVPQNSAGVFNDASLKSLYDQLVASGDQSLVTALQAGVAIEQKDIADLQTHLKETSHADIRQVYTNLLNASNNHLASFTGLLGNLGG
jgi:hypothetical protein